MSLFLNKPLQYTTGATDGAETAYPSGAHESTPAFSCGSCCSIFSFLGSVL